MSYADGKQMTKNPNGPVNSVSKDPGFKENQKMGTPMAWRPKQRKRQRAGG